jgi:hypothetical protein
MEFQEFRWDFVVRYFGKPHAGKSLAMRNEESGMGNDETGNEK